MKKHYCLDCKKEIYKTSIRCSQCYGKTVTGDKSIKWNKDLIRNCIDCGQKINGYYAKRCHSCAMKELYKDKTKHPMNRKIGKLHHGFGKTGELSTHWRGGKPKCVDCNKLLTDYNAIRCRSCAIKYAFKLGKLNTKGNNNGMFNNWSSRKPYSLDWTQELKETIRKRDNHECQNCGMTEEEHLIVIGKVLCVHHIDYNKKNCKEKNLITLCLWCNLRTNLNRNYWTDYYQQKITKEVIK